MGPLYWLGCLAWLLVQVMCAKVEVHHGHGVMKNTYAVHGTTSHRWAWWTEHTMLQPLDHYDNSTQATFEQRYFVFMDQYRAGAQKRRKLNGKDVVPVFVYDGGEDSISSFPHVLPYTIFPAIWNATGGVGIALEHRYYGQSKPRLSELGHSDHWGTDQLQWLTLRQSLADSARFLRQVQLEGVPRDAELRFIYYGSSYAGARAAFMRTLYPDLVFGAISSSGVVHAIDAFPQYSDAIVQGTPRTCIAAIDTAIRALDALLTTDDGRLHALLYVANVSRKGSVRDVANAFASVLGLFQGQSWIVPKAMNPWHAFCARLTDPAQAEQLRRAFPDQIRTLADVPMELLMYAYAMRSMDRSTGFTNIDGDMQCFREDHGTLTSSKAWTYQTCTEFGFFQVASSSGPRLMSLLLPHDYFTKPCREGFVQGVHAIPSAPNTTAVNAFGGLDLSMDRLAFLDFEYDPWLPVTVHGGAERRDTLQRPYKWVANCWHACDMMAYPQSLDSEPRRIQALHHDMLAFISAWLTST